MNISQHLFVPTSFVYGGTYNDSGVFVSSYVNNSSEICYCDGSNSVFIVSPLTTVSTSGIFRVFSDNPSSSVDVDLLFKSERINQNFSFPSIFRFNNDSSNATFTYSLRVEMPLFVQAFLYSDPSPVPLHSSMRFFQDDLD